MSNLPFLLTELLRIFETQKAFGSLANSEPDITIFCQRCCHEIPAEEWERHRSNECRPLEESAAEAFGKLELIPCPRGCGMIHPFDLEYHMMDVFGVPGCDIASRIGRGPVQIDGEVIDGTAKEISVEQ